MIGVPHFDFEMDFCTVYRFHVKGVFDQFIKRDDDKADQLRTECQYCLGADLDVLDNTSRI